MPGATCNREKSGFSLIVGKTGRIVILAEQQRNNMELDEKTIELIALGASIGANCQPCLKHHLGQARRIGIGEDEIEQAVKVGKMVRNGAASQMDQLLSNVIQPELQLV